MQKLEEGKEREGERAGRAALGKVLGEGGGLRESLAPKRIEAVSQRAELTDRGEPIMDPTSDLLRLKEENADLREKLASERKNGLFQRQELIGRGEDLREMVSDMEDMERDLFGRGEEIMMLAGDLSHLQSQLSDKREENAELEVVRDMLIAELEEELLKVLQLVRAAAQVAGHDFSYL